MAAITHLPGPQSAPKFEAGTVLDYYFTFANRAKPKQVEVISSFYSFDMQTNFYYHTGADYPCAEYSLLPVGTVLK